MKKKLLLLILGLFFILSACTEQSKVTPQYNKSVANTIKQHQLFFQQYDWDNKTALIDRVTDAPDMILEYLRDFDNRPDYSVYTPNDSELKLIKDYLELMPKGIKKLLQQRMIAIHFINGFIGSGMTDFMYDDQENMYPYIIINPDTLSDTLSGRITFREISAFIPDTSVITIKVTSSAKHPGLLYVLTHEATHAFDYVNGTTPYIEGYVQDYNLHKGLNTAQETVFTRGIWQSIKQPLKVYEFDNRDRLTFYGLGGPKIPLSQCLTVYRGFTNTPFPSLYGAKNWAEDLADMLTFYHITQVMQLEYTISISSNGSEIFNFRPFENPLVHKRFKSLRQFYK